MLKLKNLSVLFYLLPLMGSAQQPHGGGKETYLSSDKEAQLFQISRKLISNCKLNKLNADEFAKKILEIYEADITSFQGNFLPLDVDGTDYIVAVKDARYIHFTNSSSAIDLDQQDLCNYNKMILDNDKAAFAYFKTKMPFVITELIKSYGYTGNNDWLAFTFDYLDEIRDSEEFNRFLFSVDDQQKLVLRKKMVAKILEIHPDLLYNTFSIVEFIQRSPEQYKEPDESIAVILDAGLQHDIVGVCEMAFANRPALIKKLKSKKYYGLPTLTNYVEHYYKTPAERARQEQENSDYYLLEVSRNTKDKSIAKHGVIHDKDGFTNLRQNSNSHSARVLAKIRENEPFLYWPLEGDWWVVELQNGLRGFVHASRIKEVK